MVQWRLPTRCLLACVGAMAPAACAGVTARSAFPRADAPGPSAAVAPPIAVAPAIPAPPPLPDVSADEQAIVELEDRVAGLAHEERWDDALAAVDAAGAAAPVADVRLLALRAELLRDLGRRHEALAIWRGIVAKVSLDRVDSPTMLAIAGIERMEGEREAALRTLAALRARGARDPWVAANDAELLRVQSELAAGQPIARISARDLLGNLRGAPTPDDRASALALLLRIDAGDPEAASALRRRAVLIAVADADAGVRAAAVAAWEPDDGVAEAYCAHALVDASPRVRLAAVPKVRGLEPARAVTLLLDRLAAEPDPTVFAALHAGLREVTGATDVTAPLAGAGPAERDALVARWRARLDAQVVEVRR
jgi:hypothetical protein